MHIRMEKALEGDTSQEDDGKRYVVPVREFSEDQFIQETLGGDDLLYTEEKRKVVLVIDDEIFMTRHDIRGKRIIDESEKRSHFVIGSELRLRPAYDEDFVLGATLEIVDKKDKIITSIDIDLSKMMEAISKILTINNNY